MLILPRKPEGIQVPNADAETLEENDVEDGDFIDAYNRNVKKDVAGTITTRVSDSNGTFIAERLEKEKLHKLLKQLDNKKSVYIYDFYFDKLTIKEIAEKHNINEDTAKKRIYRSVEDLRRLYFEKEGI